MEAETDLCVIGQCSHTPVSKSVCEDNGGVWWGQGADNPEVIDFYNSGNLEQCWQVNQAIFNKQPQRYEQNRVMMGWTQYQAIRNEHYKLWNFAPPPPPLDYDPATDTSMDLYSVEFYRIDQGFPPALDREDDDLLLGGGLAKNLDLLSSEERNNYEALHQQLTAILASNLGVQVMVIMTALLISEILITMTHSLQADGMVRVGMILISMALRMMQTEPLSWRISIRCVNSDDPSTG